MNFILQDLGRDTRDALTEIGALNDTSKQHNIDLFEIIKTNSELANDVNWHGVGSAKSILERLIIGK